MGKTHDITSLDKHLEARGWNKLISLIIKNRIKQLILIYKVNL